MTIRQHILTSEAVSEGYSFVRYAANPPWQAFARAIEPSAKFHSESPCEKYLRMCLYRVWPLLPLAAAAFIMSTDIFTHSPTSRERHCASRVSLRFVSISCLRVL